MDLPPPLIVVLFLTSILRTTNEVFGDPNETAHTMDHGKILEASKQFSAWSSGMHHAKSRNTPGIDIESGFKLCKFVKFFEYKSTSKFGGGGPVSHSSQLILGARPTVH